MPPKRGRPPKPKETTKPFPKGTPCLPLGNTFPAGPPEARSVEQISDNLNQINELTPVASSSDTALTPLVPSGTADDRTSTVALPTQAMSQQPGKASAEDSSDDSPDVRRNQVQTVAQVHVSAGQVQPQASGSGTHLTASVARTGSQSGPSHTAQVRPIDPGIGMTVGCLGQPLTRLQASHSQTTQPQQATLRNRDSAIERETAHQSTIPRNRDSAIERDPAPEDPRRLRPSLRTEAEEDITVAFGRAGGNQRGPVEFRVPPVSAELARRAAEDEQRLVQTQREYQQRFEQQQQLIGDMQGMHAAEIRHRDAQMHETRQRLDDERAQFAEAHRREQLRAQQMEDEVIRLRWLRQTLRQPLAQ